MEVLSQIESLMWAWPFLWEPQLIFAPSSPPGPPSLSACPCLALYLCLCLSLCLSLDRFFLHFIPLNSPSFCPRLLSTGLGLYRATASLLAAFPVLRWNPSFSEGSLASSLYFATKVQKFSKCSDSAAQGLLQMVTVLLGT